MILHSSRSDAPAWDRAVPIVRQAHDKRPYVYRSPGSQRSRGFKDDGNLDVPRIIERQIDNHSLRCPIGISGLAWIF